MSYLQSSTLLHIHLLPLRFGLSFRLCCTTPKPTKRVVSYKCIQWGTSMFIPGHPGNGIRQCFQVHINKRLNVDATVAEMHIKDFTTSCFEVGILTIQLQVDSLRSDGKDSSSPSITLSSVWFELSVASMLELLHNTFESASQPAFVISSQ